MLPIKKFSKQKKEKNPVRISCKSKQRHGRVSGRPKTPNPHRVAVEKFAKSKNVFTDSEIAHINATEPCYRICRHCKKKFVMTHRKQVGCSAECREELRFVVDKKLQHKIRYFRLRKLHYKAMVRRAAKKPTA